MSKEKSVYSTRSAVSFCAGQIFLKLPLKIIQRLAIFSYQEAI